MERQGPSVAQTTGGPDFLSDYTRVDILVKAFLKQVSGLHPSASDGGS
jgi:hypothetical protein